MKDRENRAFLLVAHVVLILATVSCVVPFILLFVTSFTDEMYLLQNGYSFFPKEWSVEAYQYLGRNIRTIERAYGITALVTAIGISSSLIMTSMLGYALSRSDLPGVKGLTFAVVLTLLFNGGLVPTYIMYTTYFKMKNTLWALIIPRLLVSGFNVLLMRNYFRTSIPLALIESARIDGANEFKAFFSIVLPLSLPIMATVGLIGGLGYWNDWFNGLIYVTNPKLYSLQALLNQILLSVQYLAYMDTSSVMVTTTLPTTSVRMAIAVIGVVPILIIYPFCQKYFVKGITIGAVKG